MNTPASSRWRRWFTCRSRWQCLFRLTVVLLVVVLATPVGREWGMFVITGGNWVDPKGWPLGEPWRDWDKPTDPRELAAYEHAHSLELPDSLPKPVPFDFTPYMLSNRRTTAAAYFEHLCATEAGEYIFKTGENGVRSSI